MLKIRDLNVKYKAEARDVWAVRKLSLVLEPSRSYGLVGESGSGKTSLAMAILKLLPRSSIVSGAIDYKGTDLVKLSQDEIRPYRWEDLAVVFQESMSSFSPVHRIKNQFEDIYRVHRPGTSKKKVRQDVVGLFKLFNLDESVYQAYPHELSGGMMQRVSIVLSLILRPQVLIMDEATTALDLINERQVMDMIKELEKDTAMTRINISHDISLVSTSCQEVIVMYGGYLVEKGLVDEVFARPHHPYTKGLLDSYPDITRRGERIQGIPGSLPDLTQVYQGCIYYDRCPRRLDICKGSMPDLEVGISRAWACHNPLGEANG